MIADKDLLLIHRKAFDAARGAWDADERNLAGLRAVVAAACKSIADELDGNATEARQEAESGKYDGETRERIDGMAAGYSLSAHIARRVARDTLSDLSAGQETKPVLIEREGKLYRQAEDCTCGAAALDTNHDEDCGRLPLDTAGQEGEPT